MCLSNGKEGRPYCHTPGCLKYLTAEQEAVCRHLGHDVEILNEATFEEAEKMALEKGELEL